jgi:hypothetical protein
MRPYLRAYLAGIALPTMVVPLVLLGLSLSGQTSHAFHIEDVLIFPIGLVPNAWGLWNMLYVWLRQRREIGAGPHGACLAVLLAPAAFGLQVALGKVVWTPAAFAVGFPVAVGAYYLAWKFVVGRFNDALGIG